MADSAQRPDERRAPEDEYAIRWYESGDADGIRALFESELDRAWSPAHFEWKYHEDPYLSHVPINVAERDGELVGVQAYLPCQLRDGDRTVLALQPADAVVHADHRRNGLYTRLTRQAIDRYVEGDPALFFNYPSPGALGAQRKLGWRSVDDLAVHYRVRRPSSFLSIDDGGARDAVAGPVADALAAGAYRVVDSLSPSADDFAVTRRDSVPASTLASLYRAFVPDGIHVHREERFYEWWLGRPDLDHATYVAESSGRPVAALVTRTPRDGVLQVREAVPLAPYQPTAVFARLLSAVIADNRDVTVIKLVGATLQEGLVRRFGFLRDSGRVLDGRTTPLYLAARPLSAGDGGSVADRATDRSNWHPTFLEVDRD